MVIKEMRCQFVVKQCKVFIEKQKEQRGERMRRALSMLLVLIMGVVAMAFYPPAERLEDA